MLISTEVLLYENPLVGTWDTTRDCGNCPKKKCGPG